jgi:hypothetical protein
MLSIWALGLISFSRLFNLDNLQLVRHIWDFFAMLSLHSRSYTLSHNLYNHERCHNHHKRWVKFERLFSIHAFAWIISPFVCRSTVKNIWKTLLIKSLIIAPQLQNYSHLQTIVKLLVVTLTSWTSCSISPPQSTTTTKVIHERQSKSMSHL